MDRSGGLMKIAIIGAGPTGLYTLFSLLEHGTPLSISIYERADEAGVGMPYNADETIRLMLANIASIEIPPLTCTYLEWLRGRDAAHLARHGVDKAGLHERQFLPRVLLGEYFRDQFIALVARGRQAGFDIAVHEACPVTDLEAGAGGVSLWSACHEGPEQFDLAVLATGHVWPDEEEATRTFFPSPWSGLLDARIPAGKVGIMGTSLSAIDAAMAVAAQHGRFAETGDGALVFDREEGSGALAITLMSRSGILPEADFYCPFPYEPLQVLPPDVVAREIAQGAVGLLDRLFALFAQEITLADPAWSARIALANLDADSFTDAYFSDRLRHCAFRWAAYNLQEAERNKRDRHTVPWRYAILRLHEAVQPAVASFTDEDRDRFDAGLRRVFIDNYAAIPAESIRRLLALRAAGVITLLELGPDYRITKEGTRTGITVAGEERIFDVFIDARGQKPLETKDLPFPRLRRQLLAVAEETPTVDDHYMLASAALPPGVVALAALPYLMHDEPFIQGVTASARIGARVADAACAPAQAMPQRRENA